MIQTFVGDDAYSYVFQGQSGYLDHALADAAPPAQVTGTTEWHINADEPIVLDYNTDFKSAGHVERCSRRTPTGRPTTTLSWSALDLLGVRLRRLPVPRLARA